MNIQDVLPEEHVLTFNNNRVFLAVKIFIYI